MKKRCYVLVSLLIMLLTTYAYAKENVSLLPEDISIQQSQADDSKTVVNEVYENNFQLGGENPNLNIVDRAVVEQVYGLDELNSAIPPEGYTPLFFEKSFSLQKRSLNLIRAIDTNRVLIVQTSLPWSSNANQEVLQSLNIDFTSIGIDQIASTDLTNYQLVIIANDQAQSFYNKYAEVKTQLENHVQSGGILVIGACDLGWANGSWTTTLPGNVVVEHSYKNYNIISDASHPIVTGQLTDSIQLIDSDLYSNYCSHRMFSESSLPPGTKIILREKDTNKPTLIEYPLGKGRIIASGLTWEHNWKYHTGNDSYGTFARKALDDLFIYAMSKSGFSDYSSSVTMSINPKSVSQGQTINVNLGISPFEGKRDYYLYFSGQGIGRVWWDGTKWTSTMTSFGRYAFDELSSSTMTLEVDLPTGTYTIGAALLSQGTAMSPRPEYEASFNVTETIDEFTQIGTEIGFEFEQDVHLNNIGPSLNSLMVEETEPYSRGQVLHLTANASDPDDPPTDLFYFWKADDGILKGTVDDRFKSVQWTLPNFPGQYQVTAFIGDGRGKIASKTITVNVK